MADSQTTTATATAAAMSSTDLPLRPQEQDQERHATNPITTDDTGLIATAAMTTASMSVESTSKSAVVQIEYLSAGANRQTAVADWSADGTVAFGADLNVALWRPTDSSKKGITTLLSGHTEVVKAVKFLPRAAGDESGVSYLVTGSDDKTVKIWSLHSSDKSKDVTRTAAKCIQTVQSHTGPVNCIASLSSASSLESGKQRIFATGAADATIKIWTFDGAEARVLQTVKPTPKFFPLAISISRLDDTAGDGDSPLILAVAGTRDTIQLFVADSSLSPELKHQATLSGHEGWIRSLDFVRDPQVEARNGGAGDLLLASASQDKYIRLWRFHRGTELPTIKAEGNDPSLGAYLPGRSPSNKVHRLKTGSGSDSQQEYSVTFEALLLGHDDWIYSAKWFIRRGAQSIEEEANQDKQQQQQQQTATRLQLLSTSADNTLTIWEADPDSGIWLSAVRLGEISREKGATTATGSTGGFWTGLWSADGNSVTCLGRTGSWRVWNYSEKDDQWVPQVGIGGHTKTVTGVAWAKNGDYLLSTSLDQTTRLHASWKRSQRGLAEAEAEGGARDEDERRETWHEMSRPQIHGYDLNCIDTLGATSFVSGADEKLMRVFHEPKAVANLLETLSGIAAPDGSDASALPDAANMPVLGLSNKAIEAVDDDAELDPATSNPHDNNADREALDPGTTVRKSHLSPASVTHPPMEDTLSRHTLWPETEKLYGHGYEISCLAASHDGKLIASACRASSLNHAVIRLFETERWTELRPPLAAHTLTATRIRWSADDRYLLSVGRDRAWAVFERDPGNDNSNTEGPLFRLKQTNPKGHTRMILDAAWAPSSSTSTDSSGNRSSSSTRLVFATAGRDKQVKLWHTQKPAPSATSEEAAGASEIVLAGSIPETHPVTAIDFLPYATRIDSSSSDSSNKHFILAVGTEVGKITVHRIDAASLSVTSSMEVGSGLCLAKAVLQLSWRPRSSQHDEKEGESGKELEKARRRGERDELAVGGDDGSLRVYSFRL